MPAKDYNNYMREYMKARYHRRRSEWLEKLGGKCAECGALDNLEFDHVDCSKKSFSVAKALAGWAEARVEEEMKKCQILCTGCHLKKTVTNSDIVSGRARKNSKAL